IPRPYSAANRASRYPDGRHDRRPVLSEAASSPRRYLVIDIVAARARRTAVAFAVGKAAPASIDRYRHNDCDADRAGARKAGDRWAGFAGLLRIGRRHDSQHALIREADLGLRIGEQRWDYGVRNPFHTVHAVGL